MTDKSERLFRLESLSIVASAVLGRPVVDSVDLEICVGEVVGIVGESGSGKSTLALSMLGCIRHGLARSSGSICLGDTDVLGRSDSELQKIRGKEIAYVPQNPGLSLTPTRRIRDLISEVITRHTALRGAAIIRRINSLLESVMLPSAISDRFPHELSGGQQQRCTIALALAGNPRVLILDEPTSGLDATTHGELLNLLSSLVQKHRLTVVCISHDIRVVSRLCSRLIVMYAGKIVEDGSVAQVLNDPQHPYTRGLIGSIPKFGPDGIPPALSGYPPPVNQSISGCIFHHRCSIAVAECREVVPPKIKASNGSSIFCLRPEVRPAEPRRAEFAPSKERTDEQVLLSVEKVFVQYGKATWRDRFFERSKDGRERALNGVSLLVQKGSILGIVGESGSGKSTLLRAIAGAVPLQGGRILFDGVHDITKSPVRRTRETFRRIQLVWQNPMSALNPRQSVFEAIAAPLRLYFKSSSDEARRRAAELLELVRLGPEYLTRYPRHLSGGEAQRVAIARACAAEPDLMLCDEVTSALDVSVQAAVLSLLQEVRLRKHCSFVFVSHDLAVVRAIADDVAVLRGGNLCEFGRADDVFAAPKHPYTQALIEASKLDTSHWGF